jgi:ATP-dependent protease ClpP protease subunit
MTVEVAPGVRALRARAPQRPQARSWYRIENRAGVAARVDLMDDIGAWGVSAQEFVGELNAINASAIDLHINSGGGDAFDGLAIYQAIKDHPARVTVQVDGLAASAASFIAQAGDEVVMAPKATMMIHDASGITLGNASDHRQTADLLDKLSNNIASIYADRAGGTVEDWRATMLAETWYLADEAVAAGLADGIAGQAADEAPADEQAANRWSASFKYPGRDAAPAPAIPAAHAKAPEEPTEGATIHLAPNFVGTPGDLARALADVVARAGLAPEAASAVVEAEETPQESVEAPAEPEPTETPEAAPEAVTEPVETPSRTDAAEAEPPVTDEDTWGALVARLTSTTAPLDPVGDALASLREAMQ